MVAVATVSNPIECFLIYVLLTNTEIQMSVQLLGLISSKISHFVIIYLSRCSNLKVSSLEVGGGWQQQQTVKSDI